MSYVKRIQNCGYSLYPNENFYTLRLYAIFVCRVNLKTVFLSLVVRVGVLTFYYIHKCNTYNWLKFSKLFLNVLCMNTFSCN